MSPPQPEPKPQPTPPPQPNPEAKPVKGDNVSAPAAAPGQEEIPSFVLVRLDYGHEDPLDNILIIDMTTTDVATILTDTLRTFHRHNAIGTVMINVSNGSFTITAEDLLQTIGSAPSFTLIARGDSLEIRTDGRTVATLVMTSTL